MERPGTPLGHSRTQGEIGLTSEHWVSHAGQLDRIERAIGVHEANHVVFGCREPGRAGRPETTPLLVNHPGTQVGGYLRRTVVGAIVDHDRPVRRRHPAENPWQGKGLVQHGKHDVGHLRAP